MIMHMHALQDANVSFWRIEDIAVPADDADLQGTRFASKHCQPINGK